MRNIHLLPTDKPSRFYKINQKLVMNDVISFYGDGTYNQHLFITSDEEIKEGEYGILRESILSYHKMHKLWGMSQGKKIILTTDQELIADGVQAINDDFLQWFVKNANKSGVPFDRCEIEKWTDYKLENGNEIPFFSYKIIIPIEQEKIIKSDNGGDAWIALSDKMPTRELNGEKVLVYRIMNDSQKSMAISIINTSILKNCDINETWWMELPNLAKFM